MWFLVILAMFQSVQQPCVTGGCHTGQGGSRWHRMSWAPSWIHLPLPLVRNPFLFFFKEDHTKPFQPFSCLSSPYRFNSKQNLFSNNSVSSSLKVWPFLPTGIFGHFLEEPFVEDVHIGREMFCFHLFCPIPCIVDTSSLVPMNQPEVLRLCCFCLYSRTSKLPCAGMIGHPSAFCPLIHSSYNDQHTFKMSITFFPPKFLSTLSNCSQVLRLRLMLSWLLKRKSCFFMFLFLHHCDSPISLYFLHDPCSTGGSWVPYPISLPPSSLLLSGLFPICISISHYAPSPWPHILALASLTLSSLSSDFLPHPQGSITSSPPLCHSSSSPAPHPLISPSRFQPYLPRVKDFTFSTQLLFHGAGKKTQWHQITAWFLHREPERDSKVRKEAITN